MNKTMRRTFLVVLLATGAMNLPADGISSADPTNLVVHEWGTFTSVAGSDGEPVAWHTLAGAEDLPCFVQRFPLPKTDLGGTVRMETPVIYFYSPRQTAVDVALQFRNGAITEWFPAAAVAPGGIPSRGVAVSGFTHKLSWSRVRVEPGGSEGYPTEQDESHYYAARATDAAPLEVGDQREKFLFYRGVGRFAIPLRARVDASGTIAVRTAGSEPVATVILFENRGGRIGYRPYGSMVGEASVSLPPLEGNIATLSEMLENALVAHGLYRKEARAMIATWHDSWFEEGARIFYMVPRKLVDEVLPLSIDPQPSAVERVFVGRVELITAATKIDVADALSAGDVHGAAKYGRLLPSIVESIQASAADGRTMRAADPTLQ